MSKILFILLFLFSTSTSFAQVIDPQYIFVRKDPMTCNPSDCSQLWNFGSNTDFMVGFNDILSKITTRGNTNRKLGIGVQINYNLFSQDILAQNLKNFLSTAKSQNIPVLIALDGSQWLGMPNIGFLGKPEIWNWWDTTKPGYDPANINNVEWTCWDKSQCALKKGWRNWGSEMEILPPMNLGSQELIINNKLQVKFFANIISNWYNNELGPDQKWLLGAINTGIETDIGFSSYTKIANTTETTTSGSQQIGYSALVSKNMRTSGGRPTTDELNKIVSDYIEALNSEVINANIPRNKIFNHTFAVNLNDPNVYLPNSFQDTRSALTTNGNPGWSLYRPFSDNTSRLSPISEIMNTTSNNEWSTSEFWVTNLNYDNEDTPAQRAQKDVEHENLWFNSLNNTLNYGNARYINIANWESLRLWPTILKGIIRALNTNPSCWITKPTVSVSISGNSATISWQKGTNNNIMSLNISDNESYAVSGILQNPNIYVANNTTLTSHTINGLIPGKKYVAATIIDGCNQRRITYDKFEINPNSDIDFNNNGFIDFADFGAWKTKYLAGQSTINDFGKWKQAYLAI